MTAVSNRKIETILDLDSYTLLIRVEIDPSTLQGFLSDQADPSVELSQLMVGTTAITDNLATIKSSTDSWTSWCEKLFTSLGSQARIEGRNEGITNPTFPLPTSDLLNHPR